MLRGFIVNLVALLYRKALSTNFCRFYVTICVLSPIYVYFKQGTQLCSIILKEALSEPGNKTTGSTTANNWC